MIHFLELVIAYFLIGCFAAGAMYGNQSLPPDMYELVIVIVGWPIVAVFSLFAVVFGAVLSLFAAVFGAGAWIAKELGGGS